MILNTPFKKKDIIRVDGNGKKETPTENQKPTYIPTDIPTEDQKPTDTATKTTPTVAYNDTSFIDTPEGKALWEAYVNAANSYNQGSAFTYANQGNIDSIMQQILAGQNFKYDFNEDAMYQQYKDAYARQAKLASQDVMGQAAAMTGGYGNSYAASVGNQAYQAELGKLNDVIPELYQLALDRHNMDQNQLMQKYSVYADDYNRQYTNHLNKLSALGDARDAALNTYKVASGEYYDKQYNDNANSWKQAEFDRDQIWRDEDIALDAVASAADYEKWLLENGFSVDPTTGAIVTKPAQEDFSKATFARIDSDGNHVFYIDGKEQTFAPGVNPYTGTKNKDVANGTFSNGYQPNSVNGQALSKTGITDVVNGVTQNVWQTPDGTKWIWDGTQNKYLIYED